MVLQINAINAVLFVETKHKRYRFHCAYDTKISSQLHLHIGEATEKP